jgi:hypothetical protein
VAAGVAFVKVSAMPRVDSIASARSLWRTVESKAGSVCIGNIQRDWLYGLNYYSVTPLPSCAAQPKPFQLRQDAGRPFLAAAPR